MYVVKNSTTHSIAKSLMIIKMYLRSTVKKNQSLENKKTSGIVVSL